MGELLGRYLKSPILASVAKIVGGNFIVTVIQLATGFLLARWILPKDMGIWNTAQLATVYFPVLSVGIYSGLNRELPYLIGKGRVTEAEAFASSAYGFSIVLALLTVVAVPVVAIWYWRQGNLKVALTVVATGTTVVFTWVISYLGTTYRTHSEFGRLSANTMFVSFVGLALMMLVWRYEFWGMLIRAPMISLLGLAALFYHRPVPVRPRWDWQRLLVLCKVGVPIYLLGQAWTFFMSMDRLTLVDHTQALGYYTLAMQASTAAQMIPTAFTVVIFPRLAQIYGETGRAMPLWILARKAAIGATLLGSVVGILGWIATPWVVNGFLPNYKPGIVAAQWISFMGLAMGTYVFGNIFNVIRRQDLFAIGWIIGLGGFWGSWWVLGRMGEDKTVIAAQSLLVGTLLLSLTGVFTSLWVCRRHDRVRCLAENLPA